MTNGEKREREWERDKASPQFCREERRMPEWQGEPKLTGAELLLAATAVVHAAPHPPAAGAEGTSYSCATIACPLVLPTAETAQSIQPAIALNQLSTWFLLAVTKKLLPFISLLIKEVATSSFLIG